MREHRFKRLNQADREYHSLLKNSFKDEPVMLARHIQQEIKKVHAGLEMVGLLEGLAHFE